MLKLRFRRKVCRNIQLAHDNSAVMTGSSCEKTDSAPHWLLQKQGGGLHERTRSAYFNLARTKNARLHQSSIYWPPKNVLKYPVINSSLYVWVCLIFCAGCLIPEDSQGRSKDTTPSRYRWVFTANRYKVVSTDLHASGDERFVKMTAPPKRMHRGNSLRLSANITARGCPATRPEPSKFFCAWKLASLPSFPGQMLPMWRVVEADGFPGGQWRMLSLQCYVRPSSG